MLHLQNMLPALEEHALHGELEVRKAALLGLEAVGYHAVLLEMAHSEGAVPALLTCCCDASREVSLSLASPHRLYPKSRLTENRATDIFFQCMNDCDCPGMLLST